MTQPMAAVATFNSSNLYRLWRREIKNSILLSSPPPFSVVFLSLGGAALFTFIIFLFLNLRKNISCRADLLVISLRVFIYLFYFCHRESVFFLHVGKIISPHMEYKICKLVVLCRCIILTHYLALAKLLSLFRTLQTKSKNKAFPEPHLDLIICYKHIQDSLKPIIPMGIFITEKKIQINQPEQEILGKKI